MGQWEKAEQLKFSSPPTGTHRHMQHQQMLEDVHRFLTSMTWEPNEKEGGGITWIELMAMFEATGNNWAQTKEGERDRLKSAKKY